MGKSRLSLLPIFCIGIQFSAFAAEDSAPPVAEMDSLIAAGQYEQAFDLGKTQLEKWEGDESFDFLYGLAALEADQPNEAVFALERAAAVSTDSVLRGRARLELARAYFVTNNLSASENLFNAVLEDNPPENVRQNIQAFLLLIETRQEARDANFSWTLSSSVGSDDNINSATNNSLIDTPLIGLIELDPDGQETDDNFVNSSLVMAYTYPLDRNRSFDAQINYTNLNNFSTDQFDIDSLRGALSYSWGSQVNRFTHGLSLSQVSLDGEGFQDAVALNSSWQRTGSNGWYQSLAASYSQIRFDTGTGQELNDLRDVDQVLLTAGLTKIAGAFTHSVNLYHADEDPENPNGGSHNGRKFTGLAYSMLYRLNGQHTPFLRISAQDVEHDSEHPVFFNTTRSDDNQSATLGWFWQVNRKFLVTGDASYTDNSSNIELFDFSRLRLQAGFRYRF
ncbi:MAG: tetratricopeptide repeat protein [Pseudohongiellaceae bacterium]